MSPTQVRSGPVLYIRKEPGDIVDKLYDDDDDLEASEPPRAKKRNLGRKFKNVMVVLLIVVLLGAVLYLLSDRNSRSYFIVPENGKLVIKKGRFLPMGEVEYQSQDPLFASAYASIEIPRFAEQQMKERFSERAELDQVLATRLLSWSRAYVDRDSSASIRRAVYLLERITLLPVTSVQQKQDLEELYREVAFYQGRESLRLAQVALKESLSYFQRATKAKERISRRARHATKVLSQMTKELDQVVKIIDDPNKAVAASTSSTSTTTR